MRAEALACALLLASPVRAEECPRGATTKLEIEILYRPEHLMHDQNVGRERLKLSNLNGSERTHVDSNDARWQCLAYSADRGHVIGIQGETGVLYVTLGISYLAEDAQKTVPSAFTRGSYLAYSVLARADGRYVAFVGNDDRSDIALFVLDTRRDTVRKLGAAPKPPPDPRWQCDDGFEWGVMCIDGYQQLEPEIWHFEGNTLVVSYGKDSLQRRAKQRKVRKFRL